MRVSVILAGGDERLGIVCIVAIIFEKRAVDLIGSTLADQVDLAGAEAILSWIDTALDFELSDCVLRQNHRRSHKRLIGVDQSVKRVVVAFWTAAVDADGVGAEGPAAHHP